MNDLELLLRGYTELQTLLERKVWTSVRVHDLLIPANALQSRLHVFGQNLVRFTHDSDYKIQLIGSATGLVYRGSRFLVCTAHQVKDHPEKDIGVISIERQSYISSAGHTRFRASGIFPESDSIDLCAFDFTNPTAQNPALARRFFNLRSDDILRDDDEAVGYLAYGCPFSDQNYDISDNNHIGTAIRSMTCEPEPQPADSAIGKCRLMSTMNFDPNGLSGGPVFATVPQSAELVLKFAGVINRAGNGYIHFIKAGPVCRLLDLTINQAG